MSNAVDPAALPAWVQAIGAIVALIIAIALPYVQQRSERQQLRTTFASLADQAVIRVEWLIDKAKQKAVDPADFSTLRLGEITGMMARLPWDKLPPGDQLIVLEFTALCRRVTDFWNEKMEHAVASGIPCTTDILEGAKSDLGRLRKGLTQ